jgi:hypothetical protein
MKRSKLSEVDCVGRNSRTKGSKLGVQLRTRPKNSGKYYIRDNYIYGPKKSGKFYIHNNYIYGPNEELPWLEDEP